MTNGNRFYRHYLTIRVFEHCYILYFFTNKGHLWRLRLQVDS